MNDIDGWMDRWMDVYKDVYNMTRNFGLSSKKTWEFDQLKSGYNMKAQGCF